jgi:hypothetical protein
VSLGLPFLERLLDAPSTRQKALILEGNLLNGFNQLEDAFSDHPYHRVYPIDFTEDSDVNVPNAAWPWSINNKIIPYQFKVHKRRLKEWAYVMWDYVRLEDWGVLDIGAEEFTSPYGGDNDGRIRSR